MSTLQFNVRRTYREGDSVVEENITWMFVPDHGSQQTPPESVLQAAEEATGNVQGVRDSSHCWVPVVVSNPSYDIPLDPFGKPDISDISILEPRTGVTFIEQDEFDMLIAESEKIPLPEMEE
jgi:hypothetical protein